MSDKPMSVNSTIKDTFVDKQPVQNTHKNYTRDDIETELETILNDHKFAAAPQMSAFLRFVVMQTLDGNAERIKAYTVAVDALGKPDSFDPQSDPSVRVLAKRLRDTLTAYYERTADHKVYLRLYAGSYIPQFQPAENTQSGFGTKLCAVNNQPPTEAESNRTTTEDSDLSFSRNNIAKPQ